MRHCPGRFAPLFLLLVPFLVPGCSQENGADQEAATTTTAEPAGDTSLTTTSADTPGECRFTMGWDPWEPYQYRNAQGEVAGLDVDIARAVSRAAGCELDFVNGKWMDMLNRLRDGDVDLLAGATSTPGREEFAVFTAPYRSESFTVYTLKDNDRIRAADSLAALLDSDARIGTVAEYYYGEETYALMEAAEAAGRLEEAAVSEVNYRRLLDGEIDAFLDDPFVASSILRTRGWGDRIVATDISTATGRVAFMISRQSVAPELAERFKGGLQQIKENGELAAILDEYRN